MKNSLSLVLLLLGWTTYVFADYNPTPQSTLYQFSSKNLPIDACPLYGDDWFVLAFGPADDSVEAIPLLPDIEGDYYLLRIIDGDRADELLKDIPHIWTPDGAVLLKTDIETAQRIGRLGWGLTRLNPTVKATPGQFTYEPPLATVVDSNIVDMISSITAETSRQLIAELSAFPTRYSFAQGCRQAEQYSLDKFSSYGLTATYHNFSLYGTNMRNVIGEKPGQARPESIIIVIAHLDCTSESPDLLAPGAEDNASGSAAVFETARVISEFPTDLTIRFVVVTGEEQGLVGSDYYASYVQGRGEIIAAVINVDMVGYSGPYAQDMHIFCDPLSFGLGALGSNIVANYTTLDTVSHYESYPRYGSDHYPFATRGYPAIFFIDAWMDGFDWYPYYHTTADTTGQLNMNQQASITKAVAAMTATLARPDFGPAYLPGDANGSGDVNGIDVTFMVNYFKGGPTPEPLLRVDCNGDCQPNGLDVVYLVNYLKGFGGPPFAGDCD